MKTTTISIAALLTGLAALAAPTAAQAKHDRVYAQLLAYDSAPDRATLQTAAAHAAAI